MLIRGTAAVDHAAAEHSAVAGFVAYNMEIAQGIVIAAEQTGVPVLLQAASPKSTSTPNCAAHSWLPLTPLCLARRLATMLLPRRDRPRWCGALSGADHQDVVAQANSSIVLLREVCAPRSVSLNTLIWKGFHRPLAQCRQRLRQRRLNVRTKLSSADGDRRR
jgi:hypothetical protein